MISNGFRVKHLAAAALFLAAGTSQATITEYTSQAAYLHAISNAFTDTYDGFAVGSTIPGPLIRNLGSYSYTASTGFDGFFFAGDTPADPWLSTSNTDPITFGNFSGGVQAIGGNFFANDLYGLYTTGQVTLTATDATGSVTLTIDNPTTTSFMGFVSNGLMTSLVLSSFAPGFPIWTTADNLTLGVAVAAVPEPETYLLLLSGLGLIGAMARRRRS